jgi:hypothetical protein
LRDGVLVSKEHLVAEVFVLLHGDEIVERVKAQSSFALLEKDEHRITRKIEFISDPLVGSSGIVKVFPTSLMELSKIVDFAFHFDSQIYIGGAIRAPHVTSVENDSRDPVEKAVIVVDRPDSLHESLKSFVGVFAVNRPGGGGVAKLVTALGELVPFFPA